MAMPRCTGPSSRAATESSPTRKRWRRRSNAARVHSLYSRHVMDHAFEGGQRGMNQSLVDPSAPARTLRATLERHRGWFIVAWLAALLVGLALVVDYGARPGASGNHSDRWPSDTKLSLAPQGITSVMFVHPECPC